VWKDGRAHWEGEPPIQLVANASDAFLPVYDQSRYPSSIISEYEHMDAKERPRIQVIIPNDQRHRPFPSMPYFAPTQNTIQSAEAELSSGREVSPPSGTGKTRIRTSLVSPLSAQAYTRPVQQFKQITQPLSTIEQVPQELENGNGNGNGNGNHKTKASLSNSSSSSDSSDGDDDGSVYSKRSSMTSYDGEQATCDPTELPISLHSRSGSVVFSIKSPVSVGVFDDAEPAGPNIFASVAREPSVRRRNTGSSSRQRASPQTTPQAAPPPLRTTSGSMTRRVTSGRQQLSHAASLRRQQSGGIRRQNSNNLRRSSSISQSLTLELVHKALQNTARPSSPTLSEAEHDLERHLSALTEDAPVKWDDVSYPQQPVPAVPAKSIERAGRTSVRIPVDSGLSPSPAPLSARAPSPGGRSIKAKMEGLKLTIPENKRPKPVESRPPTPPPKATPVEPTPEQQLAEERNISAQSAEILILHMMEPLYSLDDLFTTATLNKGFYNVFKRYELHLIRSVLKNMSAPAWEFRETCPPYPQDAEPDSAAPAPEYTPRTYYQYYKRDAAIIAAVKGLILEKCQSIIRPETNAALAEHNPNQPSRVDDALWRIWTFCKLFGSGKGREEDIVAQMDWLRGGVLCHQKTCRATIMSSDNFDMNSVLANAPECFGQSNLGGITAEELYDVTELWTCLDVLLQGIDGRTEQARQYGIYDCTDVLGGDIDGEERMAGKFSLNRIISVCPIH
jgi:hypothetical protein